MAISAWFVSKTCTNCQPLSVFLEGLWCSRYFLNLSNHASPNCAIIHSSNTLAENASQVSPKHEEQQTEAPRPKRQLKPVLLRGLPSLPYYPQGVLTAG
eukprot:2543219-Amphidinium_carterae.1